MGEDAEAATTRAFYGMLQAITNVDDAVQMHLSSNTQDPFEATRRAILQENGLPSAFLLTRDVAMPGTMLKAMRVSNLRPDHVHQYTAVFSGNGIVNMDNEFVTLRSLRTAFISLLS